MAHVSWFEADAHISWAYETAEVAIEDRVPDVLGGDRHPHESTNLEGYDHRDRIVERVEEVAAEATDKQRARWDVIYEMAIVIVGHRRFADRQRMAEVGTLSVEAANFRTPEQLRPHIRSAE